MLNNYYNYPCTFYMTQSPSAYIRVLHASPNAPGVDVYANGTMLTRNLTYRNFTPYLKVTPGDYNIKVYPTGKTDNPVLETNVTVPPNSIFTIAATGLLPDISLLPVPEPLMTIQPDKAYVRFVHLSPDAPAVDITLPNGTALFKDVSYKEITNYIPVAPSTYTLQARVAGTNNVVLNVPNITLKPNRFYTVYAIGLAQGTPGLQVLIPLDGNSYLQF